VFGKAFLRLDEIALFPPHDELRTFHLQVGGHEGGSVIGGQDDGLYTRMMSASERYRGKGLFGLFVRNYCLQLVSMAAPFTGDHKEETGYD